MRDLHALIGTIKLWLIEISTVALLLLLVAVVLHALGVSLPIHSIGPLELAYLCGCAYLLRK